MQSLETAHEGTNMFIVWTENALLQLHSYLPLELYIPLVKSSLMSMEPRELIMMKHVNTDLQVLILSISQQARLLDRKEE